MYYSTTTVQLSSGSTNLHTRHEPSASALTNTAGRDVRPMEGGRPMTPLGRGRPSWSSDRIVRTERVVHHRGRPEAVPRPSHRACSDRKSSTPTLGEVRVKSFVLPGPIDP